MNFACLAVISAVLSSEPGSIDRDQMRVHVQTYFRGERNASIPFFGSAVATGTAAGLLLGSGNKVGRGAAFPLIGLGAAELVVGALLLFTANSRMGKLEMLLGEDPVKFKELEAARTSRIIGVFQPILFGLWSTVTVGGGVLAGIGGLRGDEVMAGVGLGLAVQGLVFFLLDWAVLDRAEGYATALSLFRP